MTVERTLSFADLCIAWSVEGLPIDPIAPVLPLVFEEASESPSPDRACADLTITARPTREPIADPRARGATPTVYHGKTTCFLDAGALVLWDGASALRISPDGAHLDVDVHASSLERAFHFSSVSVMMALLLALRHHGLYHVHAAAAAFPDGSTWVIPGESSSGKSTLALAAFEAGARWLSDDALLLREHVVHGVELVGWSRLIRMTKQTAAAFPRLTEHLTRCPEGSARDFEVDPRVVFAGHGQHRAHAPVTLLFPQIAPAPESRVAPLEPADAFGRLLHASAWVASEHLPRRREQLDLLSRLVASARRYELHAGSRVITDPPRAIAELREQVRAG